MISVVIPTRDRPAALGRCLTALARQSVGALEAIVVDDASRDRGAVASCVARFDWARIVPGEGRGPAAARNAGVRAVTGGVVLFTDDDCEPHSDWARALSAAAAAGPAAGRTRNVAGGAAPAAAQAITSHLVLSSISSDRAAVAFAPTCNLGAPRELLERLPFDESYPLAAGEDRDWCARATATGEPIAWVPAALVDHRHEMGVLAFLRQQARYGRGAARFRRRGATPEGHRPRPGFYAGFLRAGFAEGAAAGALVCAAQLATGAGFALERASPG